MMIKNFWVGLALAVMLVGAISCSEEETIVDPPPPTAPVYESPDLLMQAFVAAYELRDVKVLARVINPEFEFFITPQTRDEFPNVGPSFDYTAEMRIAERMFRGDPVVSPYGNIIPGISTIAFDSFVQLDEWVFVDSSPEVFSDYRANFQVSILMSRLGFLDFRIIGELTIYVRSQSTNEAESENLSWQIVRITDLTGLGKTRVEESSFGSVQALFWVPEPAR